MEDKSPFSRFDFVGVVIPGATLLLGLWIIDPNALGGLELKDVTLGTLGVFAIASFCLGHMLQALAAPIEWLQWRIFGMPSFNLIE